MARHRAVVCVLGLAIASAAACGSSTTAMNPLGGKGGSGSTGTAGGSGGGMQPSTGGAGPLGTGGAPPCSDLFAQTLQTFSIDISAADLAAVQNEFITIGALPDHDFVQYQPASHPVVFHYGAETVTDASIRLRGDSSWREAVEFDGVKGKMQLAIVFDDFNPDASFHGVSKIKLDMPRTDPTFLRDRIANTWLRSIGVPAACSTSARLLVNGNFYGVFVAEEPIGHRLLEQFFPGNADGDLFDEGQFAETNKLNPDRARLQTFWDATTPAALTAIVDVPGSLLSWAAEALLNDADGYWGGDHNFFIYDEGARGYVFFPHDLDSSLDYLGRFDTDPIAWWSVRDDWTLPIPQHYLIVIHDDGLRRQYIEALRAQLARFDVGALQSSIDVAAGQIRAAVAADPHKPIDVTTADFEAAVALARDGIAARAQYVARWLACQDGGSGTDADGDGVIWCNDCRDDLAAVHPGAAEVCGNQFDDDCDGVFDDGCR